MKINDSPKYSAKEIREAICKLEPMLGRAVIDSIVCDLERHGLLQNDNQQHSLEEIQNRLEDLFDKEVGEMLSRYIQKALLSQNKK